MRRQSSKNKKAKIVKDHIGVYFLNIHTFNPLNSCHNTYTEALQNTSVSCGTNNTLITAGFVSLY